MNTITNNQANFNGKLVKGGYLSKNFVKTEKELSDMIKDKPYDVYVRGSLYNKGKRIKRVTHFSAQNYGYLPIDSYALKTADTYTTKTKQSSYKYAMQTLINNMDAQLTPKTVEPKKVSFKEKAINLAKKIIFE